MESLVPVGSLAARRLASPVFSKMPFLTNIFTSGQDEDLTSLTYAWPTYEVLFSRFLSYERRLLGLTGDFTRSGEMRELLKVEIDASKPDLQVVAKARPRENWNAGQQGKLTSFLTLHRLLDVMAWLKGIGTRAPVLHNRGTMVVPGSLPVYDDIQNWPQRALEFRRLLDSTPNLPEKSPSNESHSSRLLHFLVSNSGKALQAAIIANLVAAATYLSYMREFRRNGDEFPDLPDQINSKIIAETSSPQERAFLEQLRDFMKPMTSFHSRTKDGGVSLASFRAVLQAASLISPTYLASSSLLAKRSWGKGTLLHTAQYLGNDKPPELLETEIVFWETIFALVDGTLHPNGVMAKLTNDLPWQSIEAIAAANDAGSWFNLSKVDDIPASVSSNPSSVNDSLSNKSSQIAIVPFDVENSGHKGAASSTTSENDTSGEHTDQSMTPGGTGDSPGPDGSRMLDQVPFPPTTSGNDTSGEHTDQSMTPGGSGASSGPDGSRTPDQVPVAPTISENDDSGEHTDQNMESGGNEDLPGLDRSPTPDRAPVPLTTSENDDSGEHTDQNMESGGNEDLPDPDRSPTPDCAPAITQQDKLCTPSPRVQPESAEKSGEASTSPGHGCDESLGDPMVIDELPVSTEQSPNSPHGEDGNDTSTLTTLADNTPPSTDSNEEHLPCSESSANEVPTGSGHVDKNVPPSTRRSARLEKLLLEQGTPADPVSTKGSSSSSKPKRKRNKGPSSTPVQKPAPSQKSSSSAPKKSNRSPSTAQNSAKNVIDLTGHLTAGSKLNPIDVDLFSVTSSWEPDNLGAFRKVKEEKTAGLQDASKLPQPPVSRHKSSRNYTVFDGSGNEVTLAPEFHFPDYVQRFEEIMSGIEASYIDGQPLHIKDPSNSVIAVLTYDEYLKMPAPELHALLLKKNIIVRGHPVPDYEFDEKGLNSMHPLYTTVPIQDYSLQGQGDSDEANSPSKKRGRKRGPGVDDNYDTFDGEQNHIPATVDGTLQEVLDEVRKGDAGRILNALDLPLPHENTAPTPYSSDRYAWHYTRGRPGFPSNEMFPGPDTCWGLGGGRNTITFLHVDSNGFNSRGVVYCGQKLWIFYRESDENPLSSRHVFLDKGFRLDRFISEIAKYGLEAILLTKGDLFIMRALQPHGVYGNLPTIIHGGHFYLSPLLEATAQSIFHSFAMNQFLTNTVHHRSLLLLQRMIDFFRLAFLEKKFVDSDARHHLPDIQTFSGLVNMLSLCNLVILGNVLDFRTYLAPNQEVEKDVNHRQQVMMDQFNRNDIPKQERASMMYARGIALELVNWIWKFCIITSPEGDVIEDLPSEYISRQIAALLKYKKEAERREIDGAPHCTLDSLKKQINNVMACDQRLLRYWTNPPKKIDDSELGFGSQDGYSLRWEEGAVKLRTYEQLLHDGTTLLDKLYLQGEAYRSLKEEELISSGASQNPAESMVDHTSDNASADSSDDRPDDDRPDDDRPDDDRPDDDRSADDSDDQPEAPSDGFPRNSSNAPEDGVSDDSVSDDDEDVDDGDYSRPRKRIRT